MQRSHVGQVGWLVALALASVAGAAKADQLRYQYIPLDQPPGLPEGAFFDPVAIDDDERIYGNVYSADPLPSVAVYEHGVATVLQPGLATSANNTGTIGGYVILDLETFDSQGALFRGHQLELVPPQPQEISSAVIALNDCGRALVRSIDESSSAQVLLYENGHAAPLHFGPAIPAPRALRINDAGKISGTQVNYPSGQDRGFLHDLGTGATTILDPLPTEQHSWAIGINRRSEVLGYSFNYDRTERIGVWNSHGHFKTYFVEGTPEVPTVSNRLLFNDDNFIVITFTTQGSGFRSYVVPRPHERVDLADIVEGAPPGEGTFWIVADLNNNGNMVGAGFSGAFYLKRICHGGA